MLQRIIGRTFTWRPGSQELPPVHADAGMMGQSALNLPPCPGARDAMPNGGKLVVATPDA